MRAGAFDSSAWDKLGSERPAAAAAPSFTKSRRVRRCGKRYSFVCIMFGSGNLFRFYSWFVGCVEAENKRSRLGSGPLETVSLDLVGIRLTRSIRKSRLLQNGFVEFFP